MPHLRNAASRALERVSSGASRCRIAVVGDLVLDQFVYGAVERISPEAPVPVVEVERELYRLGGAGNVTANLRAFGCEVDLHAVVGSDSAAGVLREELAAIGVATDHLLALDHRPTTLKTRVIAQHQQVVRFDREERAALPAAAVETLVERLGEGLAAASAVIVADYGKGVITGPVMRALVEGARSRGSFVAVDPKPIHQDRYRGVDIVTPNAKEAERMAGCPARTDEEAARAAENLLRRFDGRAVLITRGERGMTLLERGAPAVHIRAEARDVFDVTGAGDTTIAVLALAHATGAALVEAASLANVAAGLVVGKLGTACVAPDELQAALLQGEPAPGAGGGKAQA